MLVRTSGKWPKVERHSGHLLELNGDIALCVHQKQNKCPQTAAVGLYSKLMQIGQLHSSTSDVSSIVIAARFPAGAGKCLASTTICNTCLKPSWKWVSTGPVEWRCLFT